MKVEGKCSWFGGPDDKGMSETEPLAFIYEVSDQPVLFLEGSTEALGRNLDPEVPYLAMRWDYDVTPRDYLLTHVALVEANGRKMLAIPADWGPHEDTGRVVDLSPVIMDHLGVETDDVVKVTFPAFGAEPLLANDFEPGVA